MMHRLLIRGLSGGARISKSLKDDDFSDNVRDPTFWDEDIWGAAAVAENNQRLEVTTNADFAGAGYVTVNAHDLTESDISVDGNWNLADSFWLCIALTKVTASWPLLQANMYDIQNTVSTGQYRVSRRLAGVWSLLASGACVNPSTLRIVISGGNISFYENGVLRYTEAYAFGSYNCYVYIYGFGVWPTVGLCWLDNFKGFNA